mmetsp:Transcript_159138/g.510407  ORF Transcript_159138/g.510407 Transcript_159138/m.510407 type:complete len:100 (+) Transcript_159138:1402-1701(+)
MALLQTCSARLCHPVTFRLHRDRLSQLGPAAKPAAQGVFWSWKPRHQQFRGKFRWAGRLGRLLPPCVALQEEMPLVQVREAEFGWAHSDRLLLVLFDQV